MLPTDHRAHCIAIAAEMLADQLRAYKLPSEVGARIATLVEQIREGAETLCEELAPNNSAERALPVLGSAPKIRLPVYEGNVIPLRRRGG